MNYKTYALRKKISKLFYSTMEILTYPLRRSYNNKGVIYKLSIGSDAKKKKKKFIKKIFYYLDQNGDCYILTNGIEVDSSWFDIDCRSGVDKTVLENIKWLKKNRLRLLKIDSMEFMEKHNVPSWNKRKFERYEIVKIERE